MKLVDGGRVSLMKVICFYPSYFSRNPLEKQLCEKIPLTVKNLDDINIKLVVRAAVSDCFSPSPYTAYVIITCFLKC